MRGAGDAYARVWIDDESGEHRQGFQRVKRLMIAHASKADSPRCGSELRRVGPDERCGLGAPDAPQDSNRRFWRRRSAPGGRPSPKVDRRSGIRLRHVEACPETGVPSDEAGGRNGEVGRVADGRGFVPVRSGRPSVTLRQPDEGAVSDVEPRRRGVRRLATRRRESCSRCAGCWRRSGPTWGSSSTTSTRSRCSRPSSVRRSINSECPVTWKM